MARMHLDVLLAEGHDVGPQAVTIEKIGIAPLETSNMASVQQ